MCLSSVANELLQMIFWTVAAASRPCFCSLFLLFLLSLSTSRPNFICKELLQVIATLFILFKSKVTHSEAVCSKLVKFHQAKTWGEVCSLSCVPTYLYSSKYPQLQESTWSVPQFVQHIAPFADFTGTWQFELFWHARREFPTGGVMYKWRAVVAQVGAVYSHYLWVSSSHAVGEARGRSGVRRISGLCGSIERLDLGSGSVTPVVVTSLQQSHVKDWWAVQVCLGFVCWSNLLQFETSQNKRGSSFTSHYPVLKEVATTLMVALQGRLQGGKHQITLMWTVGRSLRVGCSQMAESCLWCV